MHNPGPGSALKDPHPVLIEPNSVWSLKSAQKALSLGRNALRNEVRMGQLRMARRCNRCWFLGSWLLEWLENGSVKETL